MPDYDDPFQPSDATVIRPRPGAGRRGADPVAPRPSPQAPPPPAGHADVASTASLPALGLGLNPLVRAASPLLLLAGRLRGTLSGPDVASLRRHALEEIRHFEEQARAGGIANEVVMAARYVLCAGLDEAVLSTPWGAQSEWAQQTLLVALHREAWGGEKFFAMLDKISQDPARHIDLMELQYICLALGFTGKYQVADRGSSRLSDVQQGLFRRIREVRSAAPQELSLRWRGQEDRRNPLIRYVPWWVAGAAALAVLVIAYTTYSVRLSGAAEPVQQELAKIGLEGFTAPAPVAPVAGPTLKTLLGPEEAAGTVSVLEEGGRTRVTLLAPDLFASGSATVNPATIETLRRIAVALNQVPGRVLVVGHTDDQPVRSITYRDNFQLSRARAVSVSEVLRGALTSPGRVEHAGAGSTQPLYQPASDPANRARNRRVEIVHVRGS
jgi:type VI secretion system protein ImpK